MTTCRQCGLPVIWQRVDGKSNCVNPDGSDHWDKCSEERTRQFKANGVPFTAQRGKDQVSGYRKGGQERLHTISGRPVIGKHYKPFTCACTTLPWETCPDCAQQQQWLAQA